MDETGKRNRAEGNEASGDTWQRVWGDRLPPNNDGRPCLAGWVRLASTVVCLAAGLMASEAIAGPRSVRPTVEIRILSPSALPGNPLVQWNALQGTVPPATAPLIKFTGATVTISTSPLGQYVILPVGGIQQPAPITVPVVTGLAPFTSMGSPITTGGSGSGFALPASVRLSSFANEAGTLSPGGAAFQGEPPCAPPLSPVGQACLSGGGVGGVMGLFGTLSVVIVPPAIVVIPLDLSTLRFGLGGSVTSPFTGDAAPWNTRTGYVRRDTTGSTSQPTRATQGGISVDGPNSLSLVSPTFVEALGFEYLIQTRLRLDFLDGLPPLAGGIVDGLRGYWPFDGDADDATGLGNNGTVLGAMLAPDEAGAPDSAYLFDGVDDSIDLGSSLVLKPNLPLTLTFSLNHDCGLGTRCFIFENDADAARYSGISVQIGPTGQIEARYGDGGTPSSLNRRSAVSSVVLAPGTWYDVGIVINGAGDFEFHYDGVQENPASLTYSGTGAAMVYTGQSALIGRPGAGVNFFAGRLDEVRLWDRALTAGEIAGLPCVVDGLRGHWPIAGNADDATPCANDGTVVGPSLTSDFDGATDGAYEFDGVDDYIDLGASAVLKPDLPLTITARMIHDCPLTSTCTIFENDSDNGVVYSGIAFLLTNANNLYAQYGDGGNAASGARRNATTNAVIPPNVWTDVAVVIRNATNFEFYVDGARLAPGTIAYDGTGGPLVYNLTPMPARIGLGFDRGGPFDGRLDDVRLYDRALSESEIIALPEPGATIGLVSGAALLSLLSRRRPRR